MHELDHIVAKITRAMSGSLYLVPFDEILSNPHAGIVGKHRFDFDLVTPRAKGYLKILALYV